MVAALVLLGTPQPVVASAATAEEALPREGDLTLAEPAGTVLVGLTVRPPEPGDADLLVRLEPNAGEPPPEGLRVRVTVDGREVQLTRCGPPCRRGRARLEGGDAIAVEVAGEAGGTAEFVLPELPPPEGHDLVERATERMNALGSYRVEEELGPSEPPVRSMYAIDAPDRVRVVTEGAREIRRIGERTYRRGPDDRHWRTRTSSAPDLPDHIWDEGDSEPVAVRVLGAEPVDGVGTTVVAFFLNVRDRPIWYRLWVDDDGLVRRAHMHAAGHFMRHRYHALGEPVTVEAPYGPVGRAGVALFGDPPGAYWAAGAAVARWVRFGGLLTAAGGAVFLALVHDRRAEERAMLGRMVVAGALVAVAAALAGLPLSVVAGSGGEVASVADSQAWADAVGGATAWGVGLAVAGLAGVSAAVARLWEPAAVGSAVGAALVALASLLPAGHSAATDPRWLALTVDYAHVVAAAVWLGGLVLLAAALRARRAADEAAPTSVVVGFSRLAAGCVAAVALAGTALAAAQLGGPAALAGSAYGRTLLAKLALVAAVLAVAAYNRYRLVPGAREERAWAWGRLRRTLVVEVALLGAVLAVTSVLVEVAPPT